MIAVQPKLLKMTPEDDPEAFLVMFERMAEVAAWPPEVWAIKLAPCLTGHWTAQDYGCVILHCLGINPETYWVRFQGFRL